RVVELAAPDDVLVDVPPDLPGVLETTGVAAIGGRLEGATHVGLHSGVLLVWAAAEMPARPGALSSLRAWPVTPRTRVNPMSCRAASSRDLAIPRDLASTNCVGSNGRAGARAQPAYRGGHRRTRQLRASEEAQRPEESPDSGGGSRSGAERRASGLTRA